MLLTGREKLERLRDGRRVFVGAERVHDVTAHPAFRHGAETVAGLYDFKADPANRDLLSFEEDGERYSLYWLRCRSREDLVRRMRALRAIADFTYGMFGRSPDHVAGLVTGLAMNPSVLDDLHAGCGENLLRYYEYARRICALRPFRRPACAAPSCFLGRSATTRAFAWSTKTTAAL